MRPVGRPHSFFFGKKIFDNFFFAKMKKKVSSRTFLAHPAATPETESFFMSLKMLALM